jgi:hypothetical protein
MLSVSRDLSTVSRPLFPILGPFFSVSDPMSLIPISLPSFSGYSVPYNYQLSYCTLLYWVLFFLLLSTVLIVSPHSEVCIVFISMSKVIVIFLFIIISYYFVHFFVLLFSFDGCDIKVNFLSIVIGPIGSNVIFFQNKYKTNINPRKGKV